jgi:hypothetical protein
MTKKQKFDAIKYYHKRTAVKMATRPGAQIPKKPVAMDGISRVARPVLRQTVAVAGVADFSAPARGPRVSSFSSRIKFNRVAVVAVLGLVLAFSGGMWYEAATPKISAESNAPIAVDQSGPVALFDSGSMPESEPVSVQGTADEQFFNMPLETLKDYVASSQQEEVLAARKNKLHALLKQWGSPLEANADLIAEQEHWKFGHLVCGKHFGQELHFQQLQRHRRQQYSGLQEFG